MVGASRLSNGSLFKELFQTNNINGGLFHATLYLDEEHICVSY